VSARTLLGSAAIGVVLYLAWLGWKDLLVPPAHDEAEPVAFAESAGVDVGGASESTTEGHPAARAAQAPPPPAFGGPAVGAGTEPALGGSAADTRPATSDVSIPGSADGLTGVVPARPDVARTPQPGASPAPSPDSTPSRRETEPDPDREKTRERSETRQDIAGSVLDRSGSPVAGLAVQAQPRRLFASLEDGAEPAFQTPARVVTDAAGRFAFAQLADGEYELRTDATELYEQATALVRAGVDSAVLVVEAKSGRTLLVHGVVESARGGPLRGVRVEALGRPAPAAVSDDSGGYGIRISGNRRDQDVWLRFARDGYRDQRVAIGAGEAASSDDVVRDIRLDPSGTLSAVSGVVTGSDGPPVPRAAVQLQSNRLARSYQAVSDAGGSFAFAGVEESDDYRLWVHVAEGYRDHVREKLELGGQPETLDVVLQSLGTSSLRGSMVDPDGRPVPGFTLWLSSAYGATRSLPVTGDAQGQFSVSTLPEGVVALETRSAPQLSVSGIQLAGGASKEVLLVLDVGPHRLEGVVAGHDGAPLGGARVSLLWSGTAGGLDSRSFRETVTDASGYFLLTQLGSGVHTLSVTAAGYQGARRQPQIGSVTTPLQIKLRAMP